MLAGDFPWNSIHSFGDLAEHSLFWVAKRSPCVRPFLQLCEDQEFAHAPYQQQFVAVKTTEKCYMEFLWVLYVPGLPYYYHQYCYYGHLTLLGNGHICSYIPLASICVGDHPLVNHGSLDPVFMRIPSSLPTVHGTVQGNNCTPSSFTNPNSTMMMMVIYNWKDPPHSGGI